MNIFSQFAQDTYEKDLQQALLLSKIENEQLKQVSFYIQKYIHMFTKCITLSDKM